jgi:methylthioribose-1-phosphate isomerase
VVQVVAGHRGSHFDLIPLLQQQAAELLNRRKALDHLIGEAGEGLVTENMRVLLHGSSGALSTGGYGTALGVVKTAVSKGRFVKVIVAESRPDMAGGRICAWEAAKCGVSTSVCVDAAVGHVISTGLVDAVLVEAHTVWRRRRSALPVHG